MSNKNTVESSSRGIGFNALLLLTFIVLKLTNVITWSWVWVLSPLWLPLTLLVFIIIVLLKVKK